MKNALLLACLVMAYTAAATAEPAFRCNGRIIRVGVPAAYVVAACGAPETEVVQESLARTRTASGSSRAVGIALAEQWIYDRGWGRFPAVLIFLDGRLQRIDFLPYRSDKTTTG